MRDVTTPAWIRPVWMLLQVWIGGTGLVGSLTDPDAWSGPVYATLTVGVALVCTAFLALAVRNGVHLWRRDPRAPGAGVLGSAVPVAVVSALAATGPVSSGYWAWWAVAPCVLAVFLVVLMVRDARLVRRLPRAPRPARPWA